MITKKEKISSLIRPMWEEIYYDTIVVFGSKFEKLNSFYLLCDEILELNNSEL